MSQKEPTTPEFKRPIIILIVVCIVAICGIVYELLISTAASYLLGNSIKQFSIIIGIYMSSMGLGAYISKFFNNKLFERFIQIEILLSIVGGSSILGIFYLFSLGGLYFEILLYLLTTLIGTFVGLEIPLVIRIMEHSLKLKENVANVLAFDYVGGLIGSIAFPLVLLPGLGLIRTSLLIGFLNLLSAVWLFLKTSDFKNKKRYIILSIALMIILTATFFYSKPITSYLEQNLYKDKIIYSLQTKYQQVVVTKWKDDIRLFIDGNLQFSSRDEYRYHEALVHIPVSLSTNIEKVLILGGGDGLAVRELLKYSAIKKIELVDLDKKLVDLFKTKKVLTRLNKNSLNNKKVTIHNIDAIRFLENDTDFYDLIIIDLPDPRTATLSNLYNLQFYELVHKKLSRTGMMVTQATSPFFARNTFWCIVQTISKVFKYSYPYHINVLSFGDWGFVIGSNLPLKEKIVNHTDFNIPTRFLTPSVAQQAFVFAKDLSRPDNIKINSLFSPVIVQYYIKDWSNW